MLPTNEIRALAGSMVLAGLLAASGGVLGSILPGTWTDMKPSSHPSARYNFAMAYDSESDRVILFGGSTNQGDAGDTWAYDLGTNTWTNENPSVHPSARDGHAMAYDSISDRIILYGGVGNYDTWAYDTDTNTWTQKNPRVSPPSLLFPAMAYDAESDRIVLFGGDGGFGVGQVNETWTYNVHADNWTLQTPSVKPPPRFYHTMAYSAQADRTVLFGGQFRNDTWSYDLNSDTWTRLDPVGAPDVGYAMGASLAYDAAADVFILYSSGPWSFDLKADAWAWIDGRPPSPNISSYASLVYDSKSGVFVLFGGVAIYSSSLTNETWTYDLRGPPSASAPTLFFPLLAVGSTGAVAAGIAFVLLRRRRKGRGTG